MEHRRFFLYAALIAILFVLWQQWQHDYALPKVTQTQKTANADLPPISAQTQAAQTSANVPPVAATSAESITTSKAIPTASTHTTKNIIQIDTDILHVGIDTQGGNLVLLDLLKYPESLKDPKPVALFNENPQTMHIAQSGLISKAGPDTESGQATYKADKTHYTLIPGENDLNVKLVWEKDALRVTKTFTFHRGKYDVLVSYEIENHTSMPWAGQFYAQLRQHPLVTSAGFFGLQTYAGGAISSSDTPYEKISFADFESHNLDRTIKGGWLALQQRYFLSVWVPEPTQQNHYYTRFDPSTANYTIGYVGPVIHVAAGETGKAAATLYAGPVVADQLEAVAPNLDLTIDYGWLWPISIAIFAVMKFLYNLLGNWGWSIVVVTILIKLVFFHLSATSYRSMAKMRKLTPQLQAIKERVGGDKQKMSQAMMELYKKEKVNPLSGCLPMLVQIPFFIALYYVLIESVELRQAPFIFWIKDLAIHDPYFVLPILMGLSMFLQQKLNPPPPDPMQAKIMMFLPVIFTVFFIFFPAGLVLYWLVNNCVGALQQWYITKQIEKKG